MSNNLKHKLDIQITGMELEKIKMKKDDFCPYEDIGCQHPSSSPQDPEPSMDCADCLLEYEEEFNFHGSCSNNGAAVYDRDGYSKDYHRNFYNEPYTSCDSISCKDCKGLPIEEEYKMSGENKTNQEWPMLLGKCYTFKEDMRNVEATLKEATILAIRKHESGNLGLTIGFTKTENGETSFEKADNLMIPYIDKLGIDIDLDKIVFQTEKIAYETMLKIKTKDLVSNAVEIGILKARIDEL